MNLKFDDPRHAPSLGYVQQFQGIHQFCDPSDLSMFGSFHGLCSQSGKCGFPLFLLSLFFCLILHIFLSFRFLEWIDSMGRSERGNDGFPRRDPTKAVTFPQLGVTDWQLWGLHWVFFLHHKHWLVIQGPNVLELQGSGVHYLWQISQILDMFNHPLVFPWLLGCFPLARNQPLKPGVGCGKKYLRP